MALPFRIASRASERLAKPVVLLALLLVVGAGAGQAASPPKVIDLQNGVPPSSSGAGTGTDGTVSVGVPPTPAPGQAAGDPSSWGSELAIFIGRLHLIKGQLRVSMELAEMGQMGLAARHFDRPLQGLYDDIATQLSAYRIPPFATELQTLAGLAAGAPTAAAITTPYKSAEAAVEKAISTPSRDQQNAADFVLDVAHGLLKEAAGDYRRAVSDGAVVNLDAYLDGRAAFIEAQDLVTKSKLRLRAVDAEAFAMIDSQVAALARAWPAALPPQALALGPDSVDDAVGRIGIAAQRFH